MDEEDHREYVAIMHEAIEAANEMLADYGASARWLDGRDHPTVKADCAVLIEGDLGSGMRGTYSEATFWLLREVARRVGDDDPICAAVNAVVD